MNLLFCLATSEQGTTSTNPAGSFQMFMTAAEKGDNKKNAGMRFGSDFMPQSVYFLVMLRPFS